MAVSGQRDERGTLLRIQGEFAEMPGLCPTLRQASRLWNLDPEASRSALEALVNSGVLRRTDDGRFVATQPTTRGAASSPSGRD